jgi:hypothetical protein
MRQKIKLCLSCQKLAPVNDSGLCQKCAKNRRLERAKEKGLIPKEHSSVARKNAEYQTFKEIWDERPRICEHCGIRIEKYHIRNFHHIKTKGAHPELRCDKTNIKLLCFACHDKEHGFNPRK